MVTRLYFHEALSSLIDLPSTSQGDLTSFGGQDDGVSVNRTMDTTIGDSSSQSKNIATLELDVLRRYYFTRFVSPALSAQIISSNTWTYNIHTNYLRNGGTVSLGNFPVDGTNKATYACVYIWRPSLGSVVGFVIDGNTSAQWNEYSVLGGKSTQHVNFSGASVSIEDGDVLCIELIFPVTQTGALEYDISVFYDGDTESTTAGTNVASPASFLETPQDLTFAGAGPIEMDVTDTVVLTNKFITKV